MKTAVRRSLSLILCLCLCLSFMPVVKAEYVASGTWGNLSWTLDSNGKLVISGNGEMQKASFSAPYPWKEYRDSIISVVINEGVTSISNSAFGGRYAGGEPYACSNLTSVMIPSSMTSIEAYAFWDCSSLTSINIPFGVTSIEEWAFRECSSLTSINIPSSVTNIGECAFSGCTSLTRIDADEANQTYCDLDGVLCNKSGSTIMCYPGGRAGDYNIPPNVTAIDAYAFFGCNNLTGVTIPTSVAKISEAAFEGCKSLARVTIPDSVTIIDHFAFMGCSALTNITIPSNVTYIGNQAFQGCGMASITIPSGITFIGIGTFSVCNHLASVIIPSGVTSIMNSAFWRCGELKSIRIPTSVTSIDSSAFAECSALDEIYYEGTEGEWNAISIEEGNDILTSASIHYEAGTSGVDPVIDPGSGISVFESAGDPTITSFRFYPDVNSETYVDLTNSTDTLIVEYNGTAEPYKFVVSVDHPELIEYICITGTGVDGLHQIEAKYDEHLQAFVTQGYFDEADVYFQPQNVQLEYAAKSTSTEVGVALNWDEMAPYLGELTNAQIAVEEKNENSNTGTVVFSGTIDSLNKLGLKYSIKIIDNTMGTQFGEIKSRYETGMNILSYVVPGIDDSKYLVYLDRNDPYMWTMMFKDSLSVADKLIEIQMGFFDIDSAEHIAMEDTLNATGKFSTIADTVIKAHKICEETAKLHDQIDKSTLIKEQDKDAAHREAQKLYDDKMQFMLLTTVLPLLVATSSVMGPAPAMAFSAILGVMSATSKTVYSYRIGGILGKNVKADWYRGLDTGMGTIGPHAYYKMTPDGHLIIYGEGDTYEHSQMPFPYYNGVWPFDVKKITVREGITSIGSYMFMNKSSITSVTLPSSVKRIEALAFLNCNNLSEIVLQDGIEYIGERAFENTAIEEIVFPQSLTTIWLEAFCKCRNLTYVKLPDQLDVVARWAFRSCMKLERIEIGNILEFGPGIFANCTALKTVIFCNKDIRRIGISQFGGCTSLHEISIPGSVEYIDDYAFESSGVKTIIIGENVVQIGKEAFNDCRLLENVTIGKSVISIDSQAFSGCSSLKKITFLGPPPIIASDACYGVEANAYYLENNSWSMNDFQNYGGKLTWGERIYSCLPTALTVIEDDAFCNSGLEYVIIPQSTMMIGNNAFQNCEKLIEIIIPESVVSIGIDVFKDSPYVTVVCSENSFAYRYALENGIIVRVS